VARVLLLGDPVAQSLSPAMQNAAFAAVGLPHRYELMRVTADDLPDAIASLRGDAFLGANVTIPHQERIAEHLDAVDDHARRLGAINTIYKRDGRLVGANTDAPGFADALAERGVQAREARVLVLGAGGAAKACVDRLLALGARVTIAARRSDPERDRGILRGVMTSAARGATLDFGGWPPRDLAGFAAVVNATPLGLHGEDALEGVDLPSSVTVIDIVATANETPLLRRAREAGCPLVDGLLMLLHQGARAFTLWTGRAAPVDAMRAALPRRV
jgi:shikimate dehydrogenase